jgi:uncharacterized membrane protein
MFSAGECLSGSTSLSLVNTIYSIYSFVITLNLFIFVACVSVLFICTLILLTKFNNLYLLSKFTDMGVSLEIYRAAIGLFNGKIFLVRYSNHFLYANFNVDVCLFL